MRVCLQCHGRDQHDHAQPGMECKRYYHPECVPVYIVYLCGILIKQPVATTTWRSTSRVLHYVSDIRPYPMLSTFKLTFPTTHAAILEAFRAHIKALKNNMSSVKEQPYATKAKIVAVIDAIVANPASYMPWKEMVAICREEGVMSLIDGAHALGQETGINLSEVRPDFWISVSFFPSLLPRGDNSFIRRTATSGSTRAAGLLFYMSPSGTLFPRFHGERVLTSCRNQHLIKTSIPTSTHYVSPRDGLGGPEAPNFVMQHECRSSITSDYSESDPMSQGPVPSTFRRICASPRRLSSAPGSGARRRSMRTVEICLSKGASALQRFCRRG